MNPRLPIACVKCSTAYRRAPVVKLETDAVSLKCEGCGHIHRVPQILTPAQKE